MRCRYDSTVRLLRATTLAVAFCLAACAAKAEPLAVFVDKAMAHTSSGTACFQVLGPAQSFPPVFGPEGCRLSAIAIYRNVQSAREQFDLASANVEDHDAVLGMMEDMVNAGRGSVSALYEVELGRSGAFLQKTVAERALKEAILAYRLLAGQDPDTPNSGYDSPPAGFPASLEAALALLAPADADSRAAVLREAELRRAWIAWESASADVLTHRDRTALSRRLLEASIGQWELGQISTRALSAVMAEDFRIRSNRIRAEQDYDLARYAVFAAGGRLSAALGLN